MTNLAFKMVLFVVGFIGVGVLIYVIGRAQEKFEHEAQVTTNFAHEKKASWMQVHAPRDAKTSCLRVDSDAPREIHLDCTVSAESWHAPPIRLQCYRDQCIVGGAP